MNILSVVGAKQSGWCGKLSGRMSEDDWRGIGINFWLFMALLWLFIAPFWLFIAPLWLFMAFTALMALYGFFNLKKPKIKSRKSLLALTLLGRALRALNRKLTSTITGKVSLF
jgi:hypothetical protein